jgi:hypothetical protein
MKKHLQKITLLIIIYVASLSRANAQNWEYVGTPYINQTTSMLDYLYFADLEFNTAGDAFVGYWKYSQKLEFAKFTSGAWTLLPSPGTFPVNNVDIEVKGNNYYIAYSGVRGANMYVFVKKYNGTSWNQLGDSLLLGNSGSGGHFDFILDNNEVPTILGVVAVPLLAEKQIMQYNGSAWVNYFTFSGSAATIFGESSTIFDAQNKLYCNTQGYITSPTFTYFNVAHMIDAGARTTVGDTIYTSANAIVFKLDGSGTPYLCYNNALLTKTMAYKLNGNSWNFIADTTGSIGTLLNADLSSNGKFVFNTQGTNLRKSVYIYDNNSRLQMDSLNIQGVGVAAISDIVIPAGSNDVYALVLEIKANVAQDLSVMKHSINGGNSLNEINLTHSFDVYPNPTNGIFTINQNNTQPNTMITVYDALGNMIHTAKMNQSNQQIDLSFAAKGIYFLRLSNDHFQSQRKLIIE